MSTAKQKEFEKLVEEIRNCRKCPLWQGRKNAVPGEGDINTKILFIGEAPGRQEDIQGRPFVGAAGEQLTEYLKEIGLERSEVYITNVVKCRPPQNRDPTEEEINTCSHLYLDKQIDLIDPSIIVTMGNHATKYILKKFGFKFRSISKEHGIAFEKDTLMKKIIIFPVYHPAAILYNRGLEDIFREDFLKLKKVLEEKHIAVGQETGDTRE